MIHICLSLRVTQMWSSCADFSSCFVLMAFTAKTSFFLWRGCLIPSSWNWKMKINVKFQWAVWPSEDALSEQRYSAWVEGGSGPSHSAKGSTSGNRGGLGLLCLSYCVCGGVGSRRVGASLPQALGRSGNLHVRGSAFTFSMSWGVAVSKVWPEVTHCLAKITYWARPKSSSHAHTRSVLHWAKGALASLGSRKTAYPC